MFKRIAVILFCILILYFFVFSPLVISIPGFSVIVGIGLVGSTIMMLLEEKKSISISLELRFWLIFTIYIFVTGIFVSSNLVGFLNSYLTWLQYFILLFSISILVNQGKINKDIILFTVFIIYISYLYFILTTNAISIHGRVSFVEGYNPNAIGYIIVFGTWILLYYLHSSSGMFMKLVVGTGLVLSFYTIVSSGSRQNLLALIVVIVLWLILCMPKIFKPNKNWRRTIITTLFVSIVFLLTFSNLYSWFQNTFENSVMNERIYSNVTYTGDQQRQLLYLQALEFWKERPLVGIGYDQYRELSFTSGYSHSTFAEILSTTGIIGFVLWFIPYLLIIKNYLTLRGSLKGNNTELYKLNMLFILFCSLIIYGFTTVHSYKIEMMVMILYLILSMNELKRSLARGNPLL